MVNLKMKTLKYIFLAFSLLLAPSIHADQLEDKIKTFFEKTNTNADEAMVQLLKGSALETNREALSGSNLIRQMQDLIGEYKDLEIFKIVDISERNKMYFVTAHHTDGLAYGFFNYYLNYENSWVVQTFSFNADIRQYGEVFFKNED